MREVVWKFWKAWDYDREAQWLNEMSAKGMALVSVSFCRYEFEECNPGEYSYRLELLEKSPRSAESRQYIRFLEDTGVRHVGSYFNWVYLARKTADGPFEVHSDAESRIRHLKRIMSLLIPGAVVCIYTGILNVAYLFWYGHWGNAIGFLNLAIAVWAINGIRKIRKMKKELEKQQQIFE